MIKNYLKITYRNIVRNKLFSAINILGLSISLACCLLIFIYASEQLSYDEHHGSNIFRLTTSLKPGGQETFNLGSTSVPIAPVLVKEVPEVENATRIIGSFMFGQDLLTYNGETHTAEQGAVADPSIWQVLNYKVIQGNVENPFDNSNSVVLEKSFADKVFGSTPALGQSVTISMALGQIDLEVSGIYDASAYKTHFAPTFLVSTENTVWANFLQGFETQWAGNNLAFTYLKLREGADLTAVNSKIHELLEKNGGEDMKVMGFQKSMSLQPVENIHTDTHIEMDLPGKTSLQLIKVLVGIAVLVLLLACVNYINLTTAQASKRALEVGIRKVMGVSTRKLVLQFLGESSVIVFLSLVLSILIAELSLPVFNSLVNYPLELTMDVILGLVGYLVGFLIIISFLAGLYPAFYLSSFQPSTVLKGKNRDKGVTTVLRKGLVIFQFVISIFLISAIITISKQVDFIKNKDLGFDPGTKMIVALNGDEASNNYDVLKKKFETHTMVKKVSGSNSIPGAMGINDLNVRREGQTAEMGVHIYQSLVDIDYLELMDLELLSGSHFNSYVSNSSATEVIINEKALNDLGLDKEEAIGERIYFDFVDSLFTYEIRGVVSNIHQTSLHDQIQPMMYARGGESGYPYMVLEADLSDYGGLKETLEGNWDELIETVPFESYTLTDNLLLQYESDFKTFNLIKYFAAISIVISCLGLYALSMFFAERRFKEIGVRKVLGAKVNDILLMVSKDLSLLIMIAFVLSVPLSYYAMDQWLETFAYKISPDVSTYLLAGIVSLLIGWITISYQSIRAATTNPTQVLRDE